MALPDWNITPESAAGIAFINSLNWLNLVVKKKVVWIIFWSVEYVSGVAQCNSVQTHNVNEYLQGPKYKVDIGPYFLYEVF